MENNNVSIRDYIDLRINDVEEKFKSSDTKYQIQFTAAEKAIGIASTAQEKLVAQAFDAAKEVTSKSEISMDKRFDMFSKKIDDLMEIINKSAGSQGIYVTHIDLSQALDKLQSNIETLIRPVIAFQNSQTGQQKGAGASWQTMVSIVSVCGMLIGIFFAISK